MRRLRSLGAAIVLASSAALAEEPRDPRPFERGFPLMRLYDDADHGGAPQNFGVATDGRGYVYVGNLQGLLIGDGARWRLVPNPTAIYAVATGSGGRVLAGGPQSLLTVVAAENGAPTLRSLMDLLPDAERGFGDVRTIVAVEGGFAILTDVRLLFFDGARLRSISEIAREKPKALFKLRGQAYLSREDGVFHLDGDTLTASPEFAPLLGHRIDALIEDGEGSAIAVLRDLGLVRVDQNGMSGLDGATSAWAKLNVVSCAVRLHDGRLALGSRTGGVLLASAPGQTEQIIDSPRGLPDNQVMELAEDGDGGLFVALNSGLARLDVASRITVFDARAGLQGGSQGVHRHGGRLFVFGSAGLHVIENGGLRKIPGVFGSTWFGLDLEDRPGEFLLAAAAGIFRVANDRATLVKGTADIGAYVLEHAKNFDGVLVGARAGLHLLLRTKGGYRVIGPLEGTPRYVRSIIARPSGRAFFSTVFDGILAVDFDPGNPASARFQKLGGLEGDVHDGPGGIIAITNDEKSEVFTIDEGAPRLIRDEARTRALLGFAAWVSKSDVQGNLWVNTNPLRVFRRVEGALLAEPAVLHSFPARRIQMIQPERDDVVWVGGEAGLFRHVGPPGGGLSAPPAPALVGVTIDDRLVFDGWDAKANPPADLPQNLRRLQVAFGPLSHQRGLAYQFRLDPLDSDWSEWSPRTDVEFTTLQEAQYRLRVRTRGADGQLGPEATWSFVVPPPWYRTAAARLLSVFGLALFVLAIIALRTSVLRREAAHLSQRVEEKTRDLQMAVRDLEAARSRVEEQNRLLEAANARLEDVSRHDSLTGIANRRQFDIILGEEWLRARRQRTPLSVGILDLDHFKDLNDAFGHPEGDEALRRVARALQDSMRRPADLVARYGGEEFAFILSDTDLSGALLVAEDARARIEAQAIPSPMGPSGKLTASVGLVSAIPVEGLSAERLIEAADRALYAAKDAGRNRVRAAEVNA